MLLILETQISRNFINGFMRIEYASFCLVNHFILNVVQCCRASFFFD